MPDRSLFDGQDVVGISFEAATLPNAALTDVDALRGIADDLDVVFYTKKAGVSDVIRHAAEELLQLRVQLNVAEKSARTLTRRLKALSKAAERHGSATLTISKDGTYTVDRDPPAEVNHIWAPFDFASMHRDMATFAAWMIKTEPPGEYRIDYATWSDNDVTFRFEGGRFVEVTP